MAHGKSCVLLVSAMMLASAPAGARSCIDHAYETMDVKLVRVTSGGEVVASPPALKPLDQLLNSSSGGESVLFWEKDGMGFAKFYQLVEELEPTSAVKEYIGAVSNWKLETSCGYEVRYTPILPGRYEFSEEHGDGSTVSVGIDDPVLTIAADRATATLAFSVEGKAYQAEYEVTCAWFDWTGEDKQCVQYGQIPDPPAVKPHHRLGCSTTSPVGGGPDTWPLALLAVLAVLALTHRRRGGGHG